MKVSPRGLGLAALAATAACAGVASRTALECVGPSALQRFTFTDRAAWRWYESLECSGWLELHAASAYEPEHRSPHSLAILDGAAFDDLELTVEARQTGREYPHRDLVLVFAYRDAAHFAYAHLASVGDESAHHIQLVDGADRRPVTTQRSGGVDWGNGWHTLHLRRTGTSVTVSFDGVEVLSGEVPAGPGKVGLGSFDDVGCFRSLRVQAR
jgi:hypothetical protein